MKTNSTVALTIALLSLMSLAGTASAFLGYSLGREALKGVTQPDISPTKKLSNNNPESTDKELKILLTEAELLKQAEDIINGKVIPEPIAESENPENKDEEGAISSEQEEEETSAEKSDKLSDLGEILPIKDSDRGVTLAIVEGKQEGSSLVLNVDLKNESEDSVRFLYSFLDVRDDQGRALSAITDGLPGELPANGKNFSGTIKIPTALLEDAKELSLTLTDYPDRNLELNLAKIPIKR
ncbi:hypothetical protein [Spirulina sp. 06S082]|uniref:hypothetical protein n=1 Tax=Spirulina sp. 06S082 TaxID=3110248 RepID=UPI002B1ED6EF|nr:hypothetical protein [Spirulina sp. 06S082]MEA5467379.1 hypothetical protein [Spirulina sp. 06S082]